MNTHWTGKEEELNGTVISCSLMGTLNFKRQSVHDRQDNNVPLSLKHLWDPAMACQKINERMLRRFRQRFNFVGNTDSVNS